MMVCRSRVVVVVVVMMLVLARGRVISRGRRGRWRVLFRGGWECVSIC